MQRAEFGLRRPPVRSDEKGDHGRTSLEPQYNAAQQSEFNPEEYTLQRKREEPSSSIIGDLTGALFDGVISGLLD